MLLGELSATDVRRRLRDQGLRWAIGPFVVQLTSDVPALEQPLRLLYAHHSLAEEGWERLSDCTIHLAGSRGWRRWLRPQVHFRVSGPSPFAPFPRDHALPHFEWGLNFMLASRSQQYLLLHAAVLARGDRALILPGLPGSGKSTLAAALAWRGFRLFSDEFGILRPDTLDLLAAPRPVALKNDSIDILRRFEPRAVLGPSFAKTRKGTVAHMAPPVDSVRQAHLPARATWIVVPRFQAGAATQLEELPPDQGFLRLAGNAFNYELQGERGFRTVMGLVRHCPFFELTFGNPEAAVARLLELSGETP
ncbi:MAG: HprK-related kinase A [Magnetococcales bacterium]|nr:HprK-related kinase A [Magnetococcales bacterium]